MTKQSLDERVFELENALRPFAELVRFELSDPRYPPGSMGYHNETNEPDSACTQVYVKHGQIRRAAELLGIALPKLSQACLDRVPKYCPEPIKHDRHQNMYCRECGNLCCHEYYFGSKVIDDDLTYHRCLGCKAIVGYSSNQDGR